MHEKFLFQENQKKCSKLFQVETADLKVIVKFLWSNILLCSKGTRDFCFVFEIKIPSSQINEFSFHYY